MVRIELYDLLSKTQEYIAKYYAAVLTDVHKRDQLKSYIEKFILDGGYLVHGFTEEQLIDRLYSEMVEYSILTPFRCIRSGRNQHQRVGRYHLDLFGRQYEKARRTLPLSAARH